MSRVRRQLIADRASGPGAGELTRATAHPGSKPTAPALMPAGAADGRKG